MRHLIFLTAAVLTVSGAASAPAFAQTASQTPSNAENKIPDPNEVVCEKERDSSSRLVVNKVCMTRAQWAEQRRLNRMDIDKLQTQRPCTDSSC